MRNPPATMPAASGAEPVRTRPAPAASTAVMRWPPGLMSEIASARSVADVNGPRRARVQRGEGLGRGGPDHRPTGHLEILTNVTLAPELSTAVGRRLLQTLAPLRHPTVEDDVHGRTAEDTPEIRVVSRLGARNDEEQMDHRDETRPPTFLGGIRRTMEAGGGKPLKAPSRHDADRGWGARRWFRRVSQPRFVSSVPCAEPSFSGPLLATSVYR